MANKTQTVATGCAVAASVVVIAIVLVLVVLGLAIETGHIPDSAALPAGKIPRRQLDRLEELGVTNKGEVVLYFYSAALFDIEGDGNLFTDERVISYEGADGELDIYEAAYDEIESIDFAPSDSWLEDSVITVTLRDGEWFPLLVSTEGHGDRKFYEQLVSEWERRRGGRPSSDGKDEAIDEEPAAPLEADAAEPSSSSPVNRRLPDG